jgi:hypothetical protein
MGSPKEAALFRFAMTSCHAARSGADRFGFAGNEQYRDVI